MRIPWVRERRIPGTLGGSFLGGTSTGSLGRNPGVGADTGIGSELGVGRKLGNGSELGVGISLKGAKALMRATPASGFTGGCGMLDVGAFTGSCKGSLACAGTPATFCKGVSSCLRDLSWGRGWYLPWSLGFY
jgi:hypothetical protein